MMFSNGYSMYIYNHGVFASAAIAFDADAQAFITAASITDGTQQNAINQLVKDLKSASIWTKMKAIYPFVGGSASSHRFNLKAPTTNNSDFYIDFMGGVTHGSNGVQFNGTSGYANTKLTPSTVLDETNFAHLSFYSRTSTGYPSEYVMGSNDAGPAYKTLLMIARRDTNEQSFFSDFNNATYRGARNLSQTDGSGFFIGTQQGSNIKLFRQNVLQASNTHVKTSTGTSPFSVYIGCTNDNGTAIQYTNKQCAFATIGDSLSDSEVTSLHNAVTLFQTTLGRNV